MGVQDSLYKDYIIRSQRKMKSEHEIEPYTLALATLIALVASQVYTKRSGAQENRAPTLAG